MIFFCLLWKAKEKQTNVCLFFGRIYGANLLLVLSDLYYRRKYLPTDRLFPRKQWYKKWKLILSEYIAIALISIHGIHKYVWVARETLKINFQNAKFKRRNTSTCGYVSPLDFLFKVHNYYFKKKMVSCCPFISLTPLILLW